MLQDGTCIWDLDEPNSEVSYKTMLDRSDRISGIFHGIRVADGPPGELHEKGEEYEDGEVCVLDEFEVIKR